MAQDSKARYTLRISQELLDKLGHIAEYNGRTKNRELERLITAYVNFFEQTIEKIDIKKED